MRMRRHTIRVTPEQKARLKEKATREGRSMSSIVRELIDLEPEPSQTPRRTGTR